MGIANQYLYHLALDLHRYETCALPESLVSWSTFDEDSIATIERGWHFQAQGHARLGSCFFRFNLNVPSKSFRISPDVSFEAAWESILRQLASFSRSVLIPQAEFEVFTNAMLAGTASARRLINVKDLDEIRLKTLLNLYTHVYSMNLMYKNHPTFMDKIAAQKLDKIANLIKKLFDDFLQRNISHELASQATILAHHSFSSLEL